MKKMSIFTAIVMTVTAALLTACGTTHITVPESSDSTESVLYVTPVGDISATEADAEAVTEQITEAPAETVNYIEPETAVKRFEVTSSRMIRAAGAILN